MEQARRSGLEAVFLAQRAPLLRFLRARSGSQDVAEDLLQELWLRLDTLAVRPIAQPAAYLFQTANNLVVDAHRAEERRRRRDAVWSELRADATRDADDTPSAERVLLARERLRLVEARLAALPERTAEVFRLYRLDGVAQRDIAERLGISLSAVEKHLQRAYRAVIAAGAKTGAGR